MKTKLISIEVPEGKKVEWVNNVLTLVDDKPKDIMERIKTFEDALNELGRNHPFVCQYNNIDDVDSDLSAYLQLRIIVAALNEGWTPKFTEDEFRYYPYFYLYTKDEVERMDEDEKKNLVAFGGYAYNGTLCGLGYVNSYNAFTSSSANCGSRLALKTRELAEYCGKQFKELWFDFCVGNEFRR